MALRGPIHIPLVEKRKSFHVCDEGRMAMDHSCGFHACIYNLSKQKTAYRNVLVTAKCPVSLSLSRNDGACEANDTPGLRAIMAEVWNSIADVVIELPDESPPIQFEDDVVGLLRRLRSSEFDTANGFTENKFLVSKTQMEKASMLTETNTCYNLVDIGPRQNNGKHTVVFRTAQPTFEFAFNMVEENKITDPAIARAWFRDMTHNLAFTVANGEVAPGGVKSTWLKTLDLRLFATLFWRYCSVCNPALESEVEIIGPVEEWLDHMPDWSKEIRRLVGQLPTKATVHFMHNLGHWDAAHRRIPLGASVVELDRPVSCVGVTRKLKTPSFEKKKKPSTRIRMSRQAQQKQT